MSKIRLLYFCSDYKIGLTQTHTEQVENLSRNSEIELFCVSSENEQEKGLHERLKKLNIKMAIIPSLDIHSDFNKLSSKIAAIIEKEQITHVNVHNNWQLALVGKTRLNPFKKQKFKLIYTIHGYRHNSPVKAIFAIGAIGSALGIAADRVISMSNFVTKRFWFLKHKIDRVFYMMNKPEYRKTENIIDNTVLKLVFPAQFRKGKHQEILINAVKQYIDKTGDNTIELHLPGDGPLLMDMKHLVENLGIGSNVTFYGKIPLDEVIKLHERTNIALCPSNVETYGRCIAEPFMLGRCLITRKTGVAEDIIKDHVNGFFFKDDKDLTKILIELHNNPSLITKTATQAFKDREAFFPQNVMKTYIECLKNC